MPSSARQEAHLLPCRIWVREGRERGAFRVIRLRTLRSTPAPLPRWEWRGEVGLSAHSSRGNHPVASLPRLRSFSATHKLRNTTHVTTLCKQGSSNGISFVRPLRGRLRPRTTRTQPRMRPPVPSCLWPRLQHWGTTRDAASLSSFAGWSAHSGPHPVCLQHAASTPRACQRSLFLRSLTPGRAGWAGRHAAGRRPGRSCSSSRGRFKRTPR